MRRLPVYLLIDTSGSMYGEPIEAVKNGMTGLIRELRQDPQALETAYLSVIEFNTTAQQTVPLTELFSFQEPSLTAGGTTSLGEALRLLSTKIDTEVQKTTATTKGDWRPMVFIFTDGMATDDIQKGIEALRKTKTAVVVACAAGHGADESELQKITECVVKLETTDANSIKAFFRWVSASIATNSEKVEYGQGEANGLGDLPPPPSEVQIVI